MAHKTQASDYRKPRDRRARKLSARQARERSRILESFEAFASADEGLRTLHADRNGFSPEMIKAHNIRADRWA